MSEQCYVCIIFSENFNCLPMSTFIYQSEIGLKFSSSVVLFTFLSALTKFISYLSGSYLFVWWLLETISAIALKKFIMAPPGNATHSLPWENCSLRVGGILSSDNGQREDSIFSPHVYWAKVTCRILHIRILLLFFPFCPVPLLI